MHIPCEPCTTSVVECGWTPKQQQFHLLYANSSLNPTPSQSTPLPATPRPRLTTWLLKCPSHCRSVSHLPGTRAANFQKMSGVRSKCLSAFGRRRKVDGEKKMTFFMWIWPVLSLVVTVVLHKAIDVGNNRNNKQINNSSTISNSSGSQPVVGTPHILWKQPIYRLTSLARRCEPVDLLFSQFMGVEDQHSDITLVLNMAAKGLQMRPMNTSGYFILSDRYWSYSKPRGTKTLAKIKRIILH